MLLFIIFITIFIINYYFTKKISKTNDKSNKYLYKNYMGFILIFFGLLKLYDIKQFALIFSKYDLISNKIDVYPYVYPFIEIILGILLINNIEISNIIRLIILIMVISVLSVVLTLIKGKNLRCGCMGSFFHIPLSYTTLSENIMMLIMCFNYLK